MKKSLNVLIRKYIIIIIILIIFNSINCNIFTQSNNIDKNIQKIEFIELDCKNKSGIINNFGDINCGPIPNENIKNAVDLTTNYQEIGIQFVRTHDFNGPTDISTIFPYFSAREAGPKIPGLILGPSLRSAHQGLNWEHLSG